jgi:two-component system sensor histidine kinase YesM
MFMSFFVISIVPIAIITFIVYNRYAEIIDNQTKQVADGVFSKAVSEIDTALEKIDQIYQMFTLYTVNTSSVMEDIVKYASGGAYDEYDVFLSNQKMKFVCQSAIFSNDYVNGVFLFTPSGVTLGYGYGGNTDVFYGYDPTNDAWYQETLLRGGRNYIDGITTKS